MALRSWLKESLSANDRFRLVVVKKSVVIMLCYHCSCFDLFVSIVSCPWMTKPSAQIIKFI